MTYHDTDHAYYICKDSRGYAIAMTPIGGGHIHIIRPDNCETLTGAILHLRGMVIEGKLREIRRAKHGAAVLASE